jgi:hypothetical protein
MPSSVPTLAGKIRTSHSSEHMMLFLYLLVSVIYLFMKVLYLSSWVLSSDVENELR